MTTQRGPLYVAATVLLYVITIIIVFVFALAVFTALLG